MDGEKWNEKDVFLEALALPPGERDAFIQENCPDEASRERIHALLRHHADAPDDLLKMTIHPEAAADPTDMQIDEFRILHRLGEGGMGVVYLAEDTILGRKVALKVLAGHLTGSERALARFREEARNAAALKHPAIVPVYRFGQTDSDQYLVTEFVDGPTLAKVIAERRDAMQSAKSQDATAWYRRAAEIAATVADALDCAHRANIVHRDVKPSNILIDREHGPRLADFGIAKHMVEEDRTQTSIMGSCHYMSPEQADIAAKRVDRRSDIFSLGVVLYEMLALKRPFDGQTPTQILRAIVETQPKKLRSIDKRIPVDLETICHKAIEKQPAHRYPTAAHVSADLRCFLAGEPIVARPPGIGRRVIRFSQQRRTFLATTASGALVALVGWNASQMVQEAKDESLTWVKLDTGDEVCRVFLQRFDNAVGTNCPPKKDLGLTPIDVQKLEVGQYRLTVVRKSDAAFCEFNLVLQEQGETHQRTILLNDGHSHYPPEASAELTQDLGSTLIGVLPNAPHPDMLLIEGGTYALNKGTNAEPILHGPTEIEHFFIDERMVSNREYLEFVNATGFRRPNFWMEDDPASILDLPVIGVTLEEAEAYARWRGKRLPTLVEWQAAARGKNGDLYPGGDAKPEMDEPSPSLLSAANSMDAAVQRQSYLDNVLSATSADPLRTPGRPAHVFGNVRELTGTLTADGASVFICGRAWFDPVESSTLGRITYSPYAIPSPHNGFRCAAKSNVVVRPN